MRDPFAGYDAWLEAPMQRMIADTDAEWEAYETWCEENSREMQEDPGKDSDWQDYCQEQNRLIDASYAAYEEANPPCPTCDWVGTHDIDCQEAETNDLTLGN